MCGTHYLCDYDYVVITVILGNGIHFLIAFFIVGVIARQTATIIINSTNSADASDALVV